MPLDWARGGHVLLPCHREPTPILRLRWQGSSDEWFFEIYKASTGQHSAIVPGIDETFILYAGPRTGN